jgi:tetratricopeptide (TPR) repeat protein
MLSNLLHCFICSVGHSIFKSSAKGFFAFGVLIFVLGTQAKAAAVDFKTYLKGAREEITQHQMIIQEDPLDAVAYFELGKAYLALGRHEDEVEAYKEAIELHPNYTAAHYNLSMAYDLLKNSSNAIKHMLRVQELYTKKRNHAGLRKAQRQLKFFYSKYQVNVISPENLN